MPDESLYSQSALLRHVLDVMINIDTRNIMFIGTRSLQRVKLTLQQVWRHKMPGTTLHSLQNGSVIAIQPQEMYVRAALT